MCVRRGITIACLRELHVEEWRWEACLAWPVSSCVAVEGMWAGFHKQRTAGRGAAMEERRAAGDLSMGEQHAALTGQQMLLSIQPATLVAARHAWNVLGSWLRLESQAALQAASEAWHAAADVMQTGPAALTCSDSARAPMRAQACSMAAPRGACSLNAWFAGAQRSHQPGGAGIAAGYCRHKRGGGYHRPEPGHMGRCSELRGIFSQKACGMWRWLEEQELLSGT
jgi:hypothetical protein